MRRTRNDYRTMDNRALYEEAQYGDKNTDYRELAIAVTERIYKGHPLGYRRG